ncbi:MAG TPA: hypothetical protein VE641_07340 [Chthoniobacterales bacterium]|jgi:hypothetical protein|nr:hypothetical protein [Chthoniobacterales bacterium]
MKTGASISFDESREYAAPTELAAGWEMASYKDVAPTELCREGKPQRFFIGTRPESV